MSTLALTEPAVAPLPLLALPDINYGLWPLRSDMELDPLAQSIRKSWFSQNQYSEVQWFELRKTSPDALPFANPHDEMFRSLQDWSNPEFKSRFLHRWQGFPHEPFEQWGFMLKIEMLYDDPHLAQRRQAVQMALYANGPLPRIWEPEFIQRYQAARFHMLDLILQELESHAYARYEVVRRDVLDETNGIQNLKIDKVTATNKEHKYTIDALREATEQIRLYLKQPTQIQGSALENVTEEKLAAAERRYLEWARENRPQLTVNVLAQNVEMTETGQEITLMPKKSS